VSADIIMRLRSTDEAKRAARAAGLRFSARKLRALGTHVGAAVQLEQLADAELGKAPPVDWLTDDLIRQHRHEARQRGDVSTASVCNAALGMRVHTSAGVLDRELCRAQLRILIAPGGRP
jgi:hypothetical protein